MRAVDRYVLGEVVARILLDEFVEEKASEVALKIEAVELTRDADGDLTQGAFDAISAAISGEVGAIISARHGRERLVDALVAALDAEGFAIRRKESLTAGKIRARKTRRVKRLKYPEGA